MQVPWRSLLRKKEVSLGLAIAPALAIVAAFVWATQPGIAKSTYTEALVWAALVLVAMSGWGALAGFALFRERRADFGLRAVWGGAVLAFIGGVTGALSIFSRGMSMALVDVGLVLAIADLVLARRDLARLVRFTGRAARKNVLVACLFAGVLALTALHFASAVGDPTSNPYDDDIAYFPLVRRLVETGSTIEPFSFRRLSALGGQTFFLALIYPHATFQQMNGFDRGICVVVIVALLVSFRTGHRRAPPWLTILAVVFLLSLPYHHINTASHFSGVAFFLGLFRTLHFVERERSWKRPVLPVLVAVTACTLRQNFLAPAVVMVAAAELYWGSAERVRLVERAKALGVAAGIGAVALVPWLVLSQRSSMTPLYPAILGTYNKALVLTSSTFTWLDEARLLLAVGVDNEPIRALPLVVLGGVLLTERSPYKPLRSLWIASAVGFVVLVHAFTQADPGNLARYMYGFLTALALASALTAGATWSDRRFTRWGHRAGVIFVMLGLGSQLLWSRTRLVFRFDSVVTAVKLHANEAPKSLHTMRPEAFLYGHLQEQLPKGARVAVMLDEPYYLDFARNDIVNLDMPGYASLPPGMPYFQGPEAKADYLKKLGMRYVMFVTADLSRYHYRRDFWFHRMFQDEEIWRLFSPYILDMIDDLAALRKTKKTVAEERGIVILDLESAKEPAREAP